MSFSPPTRLVDSVIPVDTSAFESVASVAPILTFLGLTLNPVGIVFKSNPTQ